MNNIMGTENRNKEEALAKGLHHIRCMTVCCLTVFDLLALGGRL